MIAMASALLTTDEWLPAAAGPSLERGVPHVWYVDLTTPVDRRVLDATEQARAARIIDPAVRDRWICSHVALRHILGAYIGVAVDELRFARHLGGKPHVVASSGRETAPEFSLAHARDVALIAVGLDIPVGVDVEYQHAFDEMDSIVERHFSSAEREALEAVPIRSRPSCFYRVWTRKEAVLKALGVGLQVELAAVEVEPDETRHPRVVSLPDGQPPASTWSMVTLVPGDGYAGAMATPAKIAAVRQLRWIA